MASVNYLNPTNMQISASNMKSPQFHMAPVVPPDRYYKPILYSHAKATHDFNIINRDINKGIKQSKNLREKKTPLSVKIIVGLTAAFATVFTLAKYIRR